MAINLVRVKLGDTWTTLTYNASTGRYEGYVTPSESSAHQPGGYYSLSVEARGDSGAVAATDGSKNPNLRLVVQETTSPVVTLVSPAPGYLTAADQTFVFTAVDEAGGSGVNPNSAHAAIDGATTPVTATAISGGYQFTFSAQGLVEGPHTVSLTVSDYDENPATVQAAYIVDTTPPTFWLLLPGLHRIVDDESVVVAGYVSDKHAPHMVVVIKRNGEQVATTEVEGEGHFDVVVDLAVGDNLIEFTVTDEAGLFTTSSVSVLRLITDRAEGDTERLKALATKPVNVWTAEELDFYHTGVLRGAYTADDLNRVGLAVNRLVEMLQEIGYNIDVQLPTNRAEEDTPTEPMMAIYLTGVEQVRTAQGTPTPSIPNTMAGLTFPGANAIEKALVEVDRYLPNYQSWTAGEIFCGEV